LESRSCGGGDHARNKDCYGRSLADFRPASDIRGNTSTNARPAMTRAKVKYIIDPGTDRLVYVPSEAGRDNSVWAGRYEDREVEIVDARPNAGDFTLDGAGFELVAQPTAVTDFYDDGQVADVWEPEVIDLLKRETGARRVHVFDHTRRADSKGLRAAKVVREPAGVIHNDYTAFSAEKRLREILPDEAAGLLLRRFAIVNVWRSSNGRPVETAPMALCDARSTGEAEIITVERHAKDRVGEVQQVVFNPAHRWYWYPHMRADEALLLKTYDSATDGRARYAVHTAFTDPGAPAGAPPRESIETRAFVFF
jgi:hypothetical protein